MMQLPSRPETGFPRGASPALTLSCVSTTPGYRFSDTIQPYRYPVAPGLSLPQGDSHPPDVDSVITVTEVALKFHNPTLSPDLVQTRILTRLKNSRGKNP